MGGGDWWDLRVAKNTKCKVYGFKGGPGKKILGVKGGSIKEFFQVLQCRHL